MNKPSPISQMASLFSPDTSFAWTAPKGDFHGIAMGRKARPETGWRAPQTDGGLRLFSDGTVYQVTERGWKRRNDLSAKVKV